MASGGVCLCAHCSLHTLVMLRRAQKIETGTGSLRIKSPRKPGRTVHVGVTVTRGKPAVGRERRGGPVFHTQLQILNAHANFLRERERTRERKKERGRKRWAKPNFLPVAVRGKRMKQQRELKKGPWERRVNDIKVEQQEFFMSRNSLRSFWSLVEVPVKPVATVESLGRLSSSNFICWWVAALKPVSVSSSYDAWVK